MRSALERCSKSGFRPPDPHVSLGELKTLVVMRAVAALLLLCSCVCALLDNEHCPLLATIDTRMLLAPLLGIQHLPPLPPPTRPDADVTCAKKGWVVGLKAGNEHKKEPPDGGDRAHRGDGRLSTEVVRARIF